MSCCVLVISLYMYMTYMHVLFFLVHMFLADQHLFFKKGRGPLQGPESHLSQAELKGKGLLRNHTDLKFEEFWRPKKRFFLFCFLCFLFNLSLKVHFIRWHIVARLSWMSPSLLHYSHCKSFSLDMFQG